MKTSLCTFLLSLALLAPAFGQLKIAVVDIDKAIEEYYKTAEARIKIDSWTQQVQETIKNEQDRGMAMLDEIQKLQQKARSTPPDDPQADVMKQEFDQKVRAVKSHSEGLEAKKKDLAAKLQKQVSRLNENILLEVCQYVKDYGKEKGFDLVLNQSKTNPGASDVLYAQNATDITAPVVQALNATKSEGKTTPTSN
ncbi:MAG: OmpH family outer membrane protein [Verrucomicrobiota bacterium]